MQQFTVGIIVMNAAGHRNRLFKMVAQRCRKRFAYSSVLVSGKLGGLYRLPRSGNTDCSYMSAAASGNEYRQAIIQMLGMQSNPITTRRAVKAYFR